MKHYLFEGIENFRDVGGYETPYGETHYGVLFRSGRLTDATSKDVQKIKDLGIKTIVDLRSDDDKKKYPSKTYEDPSFKTILLPVNGNGRVPTNRLDQIDSYLEMLDDAPKAKAIYDAILYSEKPVLLHCNAGKDRTGLFIALILLANGVSFEDVNADYLLSFPLVPKLTEHTKKCHSDFSPIIYTPSLGFLERVMKSFYKKYKSFAGYFEKIGFDKSEYGLLCSLLGKQEQRYGAVVFKGNDILLEHMQYGHYSLPKGHIEKEDKDGVACAYREIKEECDIDVLIKNPNHSFSIAYSPFYGISKRVTFFLANYTSGNLKAQPEEVTELSFVTKEEALKKLTFQTDKDVLLWAYKEKELKNL